MSKSLLKYVDYSTVQTIKSLLSSSYLLRDSSQDGGAESMLNILRELKVSGSKEDTETFLVNSGAVIAEASLEEELWLRYELSLLCASNNRMQEANNLALSLWHFGNRDDRSRAPLLPRVLGLIAWGNAQFRSGNTVEGVACIMASIPLSIQREEVGGLVEDGIRILQLWVHNSKVFDDQEGKEFNDIITDIMTGDEERKKINSLLSQHRWEELYTALNSKVYSDDHSRDWPLDLFNYTQACVQTDRKGEAYSMIMKHGDGAIKILESRLDARPLILHVWAQILLHALPPANDDEIVGALKMSTNLLEVAISDLEKERQGFFHRDERANIMDRSRELYKMYLFTQVLAKVTEGMESPADSKILAIFSLLSFRSIEELRLCRIEPSNGSQTSEREYWALFDEISRQRALGKSNTEIQDKIARFSKLQDLLQQEHPSFSKLNRLPELRADELKASLRHRELFYQFVFTKYGTMYYLASNKNTSMGWISIQIEDTNRLMQSLALAMQDYDSFSQLDEDVMERAYGQVSGLFYAPLFEELSKESYETILICPDMEVPLFSTNLIRNGNRWLLEEISSIKNVLSPQQLVKGHAISQRYKSLPRIYTFGNRNDNAIDYARNWANKKMNGKAIHYDNPDMADLQLLNQIDATPLSIIVGHGISDASASAVSGASAIQGIGKSVWIEDLAPIFRLSNYVVIISCRSGTPLEGQPEGGEGVWMATMTQGVAGAVLCRWDVMPEPSLAILEEILDAVADSDMAVALSNGKRKLINSKKWRHPYYWAGLEYWENR